MRLSVCVILIQDIVQQRNQREQVIGVCCLCKVKSREGENCGERKTERETERQRGIEKERRRGRGRVGDVSQCQSLFMIVHYCPPLWQLATRRISGR